jgi:DNA adenine methylase
MPLLTTTAVRSHCVRASRQSFPRGAPDVSLRIGQHGSSVIRWAGSKRQLLPYLLANIPGGFHRYVEPFCGSATLFFAIRPRCSILADLNQELITALLFIKEAPAETHEAVCTLCPSKSVYERLRELDPIDLSPFRRAVRFLYLNRYCFNGVYRTNRSGRFNVPMGKKTGRVPSRENYLQCAEALQSATLVRDDFSTTLARCGPGDFVYLDPPYYKTGRHRGEYGPIAFTSQDLERLVHALIALDKLGAQFLLSYSDTPILQDMLPRLWNTSLLRVQRHVSGFRATSHHVDEILVKNY